MTLALRFRVIEKRNFHGSMEMQKVSFTYNPEAERWGHLIKCYELNCFKQINLEQGFLPSPVRINITLTSDSDAMLQGY